MRLQMTGMVLDALAACVLLAVWYMSAVTMEWIQGLQVLSLTIVFTMGAALFWERLAASSMKYEGMGLFMHRTVGDVVNAQDRDNRHASCRCCHHDGHCSCEECK